MSARRALPPHPSKEYLRKEAKRLGKSDRLSIVDAQRELAQAYGEPDWPALMRRVEELRGEVSPSADEHAPNPSSDEDPIPVPEAVLTAVRAGDIDRVTRLLGEGADPNARDDARDTALHIAARRGPLALVETLIRHGAIEWLPDDRGQRPAQAARTGTAVDREAIAELLERSVIRDPAFARAVAALHAGDLATLTALIDAEPRLLRDRIEGPACYRETTRPQYFLEPRLLWFVANNPTLMQTMPANIADVARELVTRGAAQEDLDYTLMLVMSSGVAREQGHQAALMQVLVDAGARATRQATTIVLAHRETTPVRWLLARGHALDPTIAAGMGLVDTLPVLLSAASQEDRQTALALAVINGHTAAARMALDAGADPNLRMVVHAHSWPIHQAAGDGDLDLLQLLVERGARLDVRDTLWHGTPLGWAEQGKRRLAAAWLRKREDSPGR